MTKIPSFDQKWICPFEEEELWMFSMCKKNVCQTLQFMTAHFCGSKTCQHAYFRANEGISPYGRALTVTCTFCIKVDDLLEQRSYIFTHSVLGCCLYSLPSSFAKLFKHSINWFIVSFCCSNIRLIACRDLFTHLISFFFLQSCL